MGGREAGVIGGQWLVLGGCLFKAVLTSLQSRSCPLCMSFSAGERDGLRRSPGSVLDAQATWAQPVCSATFSNINILINSRPIVLLFSFLFSSLFKPPTPL